MHDKVHGIHIQSVLRKYLHQSKKKLNLQQIIKYCQLSKVSHFYFGHTLGQTVYLLECPYLTITITEKKKTLFNPDVRFLLFLINVWP